MARKTGKDAKAANPPLKDAEFLATARKRYERGIEHEKDNRDAQLDDLKFLSGEGQWPDWVRTQRATARRPCLTFNQLPQFVRQVTGDIRLAKPGIKVVPADDMSDPKLAEILTGLIRHIEQQSDAGAAYIGAAESSASVGEGYFRIVTEYAGRDTFEQDIRIVPVPDRFSVVLDPSARKPTGEDARWGFIVSEVQKEDFEQTYPDAAMAPFEEEHLNDSMARWHGDDWVLVAEYWVKVPVEKTAVLLEDGRAILTDGEDNAIPEGAKVIRRRKVKVDEVRQYIVNGAEILEGPTTWAGSYIPIIRVVGDEIHIGKRTIRHGVIRFAKEPQQLYNFWRTAMAELIALAPKAPYLVTPAQIKGKEAEWNTAHLENRPYLTYSPDPSTPGPPTRAQPGAMPAGMQQELQGAVEDMYRATGIYPASLGQRSNEVSGKAIMARERQGDVGTFVYADNLGKAVACCGRQLIDLIPRIYDTERIVRVLGEDGTEETVVINKVAADAVLNDITIGKYDVVVSSGPSFSTKRVEAAESMMEFIRFNPAASNIVMDLLAKNLDWPGADKLAKRFRKLLPPGMAEPEPGEEPEPRTIDPQQMELAMQTMQKMHGEIQKLQADATHLKAKNDLDDLRAASEKLQLREQIVQKDIELATMKGVLRVEASAPKANGQTDPFEAEAKTAKSVADIAKAEADVAKSHAEIAALGAEQGNNEAQAGQARAVTKTLHDIAEMVQALAQGQQAITAAVMQPKVKTATAKRQTDGSFVMEAVERTAQVN